MSQKLIKILQNGGVAVIPTDTIYGVVGQALNKKTVERVYQIKERTPEKPFIIIISNTVDLESFGIKLNDFQQKKVVEYWPGPVSLVFEVGGSNFEYLHRGTKSLAFRLPDSDFLTKLISHTGPLVAPSANPEGGIPAMNIEIAKQYFGDQVDYYADGEEKNGPPSKIIFLGDSSEKFLRR